MIVQLYHRTCGKHLNIKDCEIEGSFKKYGRVKQPTTWWAGKEYEITNEEALLAALPKDFLPVDPSKVLILVSEGNSTIGVRDLKIFQPWAKYFDSYSINLIKRKR